MNANTLPFMLGQINMLSNAGLVLRVDEDGDLCRITTEERGSWKYQDAFRMSTYLPSVTRDGRRILRSVNRGSKFACIKRTAHLWRQYNQGSVHNYEIKKEFVDDYGNTCFLL